MSKFAWSENNDYLGYLKGSNTQHNSLCFYVWACKTNQHIKIYPRLDEPQGTALLMRLIISQMPRRLSGRDKETSRQESETSFGFEEGTKFSCWKMGTLSL